MQLLQRFIVALLLVLLLAGCSGGPVELLDTAQLEERQFNTDHAIELYREIVAKHPDSEAADLARERLKVLQNQ